MYSLILADQVSNGDDYDEVNQIPQAISFQLPYLLLEIIVLIDKEMEESD